PAVAVAEGWVCVTKSAAAPAISRSVPTFEFVVTLARLAVPAHRRKPNAKGVPAVGRTRTFCQVSLHFTLFWLVLVTVNVICVVVTDVIATDVPLDTPLILLAAPPVPLSRSIRTVGAVPPVS